LLTEHLKAMFFGSLRRAQDRLRNLAKRGLIESWYPPQPRGMGKASGHHTLTESGAKVVALLLGIARSELRYVIRNEENREQDSWLAHRLGVNEFFCALIEAGRKIEGHGLAKWVPERTVRTGDGWIRPDGYGVFLRPGGALDFYLEYDRGTETTRQLANKLAGYIGLQGPGPSKARSTSHAC
jgi:Replication-relaxation